MALPSPNPPTNWASHVQPLVSVHHDIYPTLSPAKFDLAGKAVLITGASKGIGRAAAIRFAAAGTSKIAIAARSDLSAVEAAMRAAAAEAKRPDPHILPLQVDVTSEASVRTAAERVDKEFGGKLDVLVNNAGYLEEWLPIASSQPDDWWHSWEVNIKGPYLCCRFFLPLLLASQTKTLINLTSAGGHLLAYGASAYQTARFAICRFTEFADREYRHQGLVAVAMHPGGVKTELALNMPEYMHAVLVDTPELPAEFMVWLAGERREWLAGRFVCGNWDVEELEGRKEEIVERDLLKFRMVV